MQTGLCRGRRPWLFRLGILLIVGDYPIRQLILHPRILVWWFSWELNPEVLGSFWLQASAMGPGGGITSAEGLRDGEAGRAPFELCPGIRLTTEEKHEEPQSGLPSSHRTTRCTDLAVYLGTTSAGLLHVSSPRLPGGPQSALGRRKYLPSYRSKGFRASANFE
jgi:hypothetical protein